jgi:hypothetical protein
MISQTPLSSYFSRLPTPPEWFMRVHLYVGTVVHVGSFMWGQPPPAVRRAERGLFLPDYSPPILKRKPARKLMGRAG